jgi:hypothetical protein
MNLSPRETRLHSLLRERKSIGATSIEIREICNTCAPGSDIADLRKKGIHIPRAKHEGKTDSGRKIYRYWLGA